MSILRDNNKLSAEEQFGLVDYKLLRDTAKKETKGLTGPQFFGLSKKSDEFNIYVTDDLRKFDDIKDPLQLAIVAPDNETFDLLVPKDFTTKLDLKNEKNLRRYLKELVDSIP
jgi:hypothetical protein